MMSKLLVIFWGPEIEYWQITHVYLFNFVLFHIGDSFFDVRIPKKINVEAGRTFIIQGVDYVCF